MNYIFLGKIVGTHGIKGEFRILSNFQYKDRIFDNKKDIYIGKDKKVLKILTYRKHKNYDMVTAYGYDNINKVLDFKGLNVYINRDDLNLSSHECLDSDIIGLNALYNDKLLGKVVDIYETGKDYKVIEIKDNTRNILIPYHKDFIEDINIKDKYIKFNTEGVTNEN